jgi:murein DD-endopeptidase MepM/ murein hydrolase activator NlpD
LKSQVVAIFTRTFGSNINFQDQIRDGDTIRLIAEEEHLNGDFLRYKAIAAMEYNGEEVGRLRAFYFKTPDARGKYFNERGESLQRTQLQSPCTYRRISSPFDLNRLHPILKRRVPHRGVDFAASRGTPVWAVADGAVTFAARKGANGNLVIIRHSGGLESIYAHLQKFARGIKRGLEVSQGDVIGNVGSTGRSTGPHLHFGLRKNGTFIDPVTYRTGPGRSISPQHKAKFLRQARELISELNAIPISE